MFALARHFAGRLCGRASPPAPTQAQTATPGATPPVVEIAVTHIKEQETLFAEIEFDPDGRLLATLGEDGAVRIWGVSNE